jgi:sulfur carrier protein ThiS
MRMKLKLHGFLRGLVPGGARTFDVPEGTTVSGVFDVLGIPVGPCLWIVNGEAAAYDTTLKEGDEVEVAMMAAGG